MARIVFFSDTHNFHEKVNVPDGDIAIFGGDFGSYGTINELENFIDWFRQLKHPTKLMIAGNHDWCFQKEPERCASIIEDTDDIFYLEDDFFRSNGLSFWGSPWQPRFGDWAFNLDRAKPLKDKWDLILDNTDVLITHGPPYSLLDEVRRGERVGCVDLLKTVNDLNIPIHLFGHIHEGYGKKTMGITDFYNGSICNEYYEAVNKPWVIDL